METIDFGQLKHAVFDSARWMRLEPAPFAIRFQAADSSAVLEYGGESGPGVSKSERAVVRIQELVEGVGARQPQTLELDCRACYRPGSSTGQLFSL